MKTKIQKTKQIEEGIKELEKNQILIFTDFTGTPAKEINIFRETLKAVGAKFQVFKKRLFRIAFEKNNFEFPIEKFKGQLGVVFGPNGLEEVAGPVYKFSKTNPNFKILGGFDLKDRKIINFELIKFIGQLPGREVLLAHFINVLAMPIRKFLFILNEKGRKK